MNSIYWLEKEFRRVFGFNPPEDVYATMLTGKWTMDIIALDRKLSEYYPEYDCEKAEWNGKKVSMNDFIKGKFGDYGNRLVRKLLGIGEEGDVF